MQRCRANKSDVKRASSLTARVGGARERWRLSVKLQVYTLSGLQAQEGHTVLDLAGRSCFLLNRTTAAATAHTRDGVDAATPPFRFHDEVSVSRSY